MSLALYEKKKQWKIVCCVFFYYTVSCAAMGAATATPCSKAGTEGPIFPTNRLQRSAYTEEQKLAIRGWMELHSELRKVPIAPKAPKYHNTENNRQINRAKKRILSHPGGLCGPSQ